MWPPVRFAAIPLKGVAVNLSFEVNEKLHRKVSPPFEGGVVGMIDYLIFTIFYLPTGVVDSLISSKQISIPEI